jgi:hypothetical protein
MPYCPACTAKVTLSAKDCRSCGAPFLLPSYGLLESRVTEEEEAALPFPKAVPVVLGLLGIGGAAWGLMAVAAGASQMKGGFFGILILTFIAAIYIYSGYCGVRTLQRRYGWVRLNQVLWAIQVPVFISPIISYSFSTGGFVTAWLQLYPAFRVGGNAWLGSNFTLNLVTPGPFTLGVNIFALGISYYLARAQRGDA